MTLAEQIFYTLYGIGLVNVFDNRWVARPCLFFHNSAFHRHEQMAGAIIEIGNNRILYLNPFCKRVDDLVTSRLGVFMRDAIFDPTEQERAGRYLIATCDDDRRMPEVVLAHVKSKYGLELAVPFNFNAHSSWVDVREDVLDELEAEEQELRAADTAAARRAQGLG